VILDDDPSGDWTRTGVFRCAADVHRIPLPLPMDGLRAVNVYAMPDADGWTLIDSGWALAQSRPRPVRGPPGPAAAGRRARARRDDRSAPPGAGRPSVWAAPDDWITDGEEIAVGPDRLLTAVETPGHTRGHLVFADDTAGLLFAGDHVQPRITPSIGFEPAPTANPLGAFLTSLQLVRSRKDADLLPAHGPVGMRVHERVDALLAHHGTRLDATLAAVREGRHTALAVAEALAWTRHEGRLPEMDPFNSMLAILETAAHLDVLVERGAVTVVSQNGVAHYTT
jgi:glyoxylase-like metal-dependent hydrolase (beta-lactamase superfamily II)